MKPSKAAVARAARRVAAGNRRAEATFLARCRAIVKGAIAIYQRRLAAAVADVGRSDAKGIKPPSKKANSSWRKEIEIIQQGVLPQMEKLVDAAHAQMARTIVKNHAEAMGQVLGITTENQSKLVKARVEAARKEAIGYVLDAHREYGQQVHDMFAAGEADGVRVEVLRDQLVERGNVSVSRAELIARDQTLKLAGSINEARQTEAGITEYVWSTSGDERVRPEHAALNGQVFAWTDAPEPGHPGEDFQCRCVAVPNIPELAGI